MKTKDYLFESYQQHVDTLRSIEKVLYIPCKGLTEEETSQFIHLIHKIEMREMSIIDDIVLSLNKLGEKV